jgi:hypothetical protein
VEKNNLHLKEREREKKIYRRKRRRIAKRRLLTKGERMGSFSTSINVYLLL